MKEIKASFDFGTALTQRDVLYCGGTYSTSTLGISGPSGLE